MVITIIGMLVGLLLPAVNMAREAGRRTTCSNNLHQLSVACLSHSQKLGCLSQRRLGKQLGRDSRQRHGHAISRAVGSIRFSPIWTRTPCTTWAKAAVARRFAASATRVSTAMPALYCPTRRAGLGLSRGTSSASGASPASRNDRPVTQAGRTDYAINGGSVYIPHGHGPGQRPSGRRRLFLAQPRALGFNGIVSVHSQITDAMIPDNKETTYLIGEKYMSPENYITGVDHLHRSGRPA